MHVEVKSARSMNVTPQADEVLYYDQRYTKSRHLARTLLPPFMVRAPLGRLVAGRYWMSRLKGEDNPDPLELIAQGSTDRMLTIELSEGQTMAVDLRALVGFMLPLNHASPPLRSFLRGVARPGCWSWGHPVPTLFHGPATLILCAERLNQRESGVEDRSFQPTQLVAFDTSVDLRVHPREAQSVFNAMINATTFSNVLHVEDDGEGVYVRDVGGREAIPAWVVRKFVVALVWSWLIVLGVWLAGEYLQPTVVTPQTHPPTAPAPPPRSDAPAHDSG